MDKVYYRLVVTETINEKQSTQELNYDRFEFGDVLQDYKGYLQCGLDQPHFEIELQKWDNGKYIVMKRTKIEHYELDD